MEAVSRRFHPDQDQRGYQGGDTATSPTMGLGSLFFDAGRRVPIALAYSALYAVAPWHLPVTAWTLAAMLLAQDFCSYWQHRSHHVVRVLWASHVVHHSSRKHDLSTALRRPWTPGATSWVCCLRSPRRPSGRSTG